ncbi:MAG: glucose-1-phosphate cytidylyltransferase [Candidatus Levybacteria bacterium CG10_big_fil_rev_8_21_14_0_10_36_7]|nr:MAG: glucose-1-phosphate cytidylyltransferase [Candidatus Levybacteria bacterium CG10_big_fil_rev_8_21_14_0_10_36_7]
MSNKKIPVVIFCGGQGSRMKEETEFRPKPMVSLGGKPILWHIMKIYAHYGFNDFIIALGYKGDYIKDYFINEEYFTNDFTINTKTGEKRLYKENNRRRDNFNITFVDTGLETLTGERLLKVKRYIDSDVFMVTYGDGVSDINMLELVKFFEDKKKVGVITGVHPKSKWGLVISDENNIIQRFEQKPQLNQYVNGGFMVFKKKVFDYIKPREMIEVGFNRMVEDKELAVYIHNGYWSAMDTYQDVEEMNKQWKKDPKWKVWR